MPKLVGGIMALVALGGSTLVGVEPLDCLLRGLIAFVVGFFVAQVWSTFFAAAPSKFNGLQLVDNTGQAESKAPAPTSRIAEEARPTPQEDAAA